MVRYGYTEEHEMFRRTVRSFLDKELEPYYKRYAEKGGVDKDFWRKAGRAGILVCWWRLLMTNRRANISWPGSSRKRGSSTRSMDFKCGACT